MRIQLLGPVEVAVDDAVVEVTAGRVRALLAALALRANYAVPVTQLVAAMWAGPAPRSASRLVQTYVWRLRGLLGDAAGRRIETTPAGYRLRAGPAEVDAVAFERLVAEGRALLLNGEAHGAAERLAEALRLWRGGAALMDLPHSEYLVAQARRLAELRLGALEDRVEADLQLGRHEQVAAELTTVAAEHPLRERLHGQLILALYRCGRAAEALARYAQIRETIREELGTEPGAALRELHRMILTDDPPLHASPARRRAPVASPSAETREAPPAAHRSPAQQLPPDVPDFVGREAELHQAVEWVIGEQVPAVSITGMPGVGKTALAVRLGHRLAGHFPDGQLFIDLHGQQDIRRTPVDALGAVLRAIGVAATAIPLDLDELTARYRSELAGHRFLIILDDVWDEAQVRPLLPPAGSVILLTSRRLLPGLAGVRPIHLATLPESAAQHLLGRIAGARRLAAEPDAAAAAVRLCGALPLAIRIVGARLASRPLWTVAQLVDRLRDESGRLHQLTAGDLGVRAAFELSYRNLAAPARQVLRALGQLPTGQFSIHSAASASDLPESEVSAIVEELIDVSLVQPTADPSRYELHDLIRLFAAERAAAEEDQATREAVWNRVAGWYLTMAMAAADLAAPRLIRLPTDAVPQPASAKKPFADDRAAMDWLEAEHTNLTAVVRLAAQRGPVRFTWLLADALRGFFYLRRHMPQWFATVEIALTAAEQEKDALGIAAMLASRGLAYLSLGEHAQSADWSTRALAAMRAAGWAGGEAATLVNLGIANNGLGDLKAAYRHYTDALAIQQRLGDWERVASTLANLAGVHREMGELAQALDCYERALAIHRTVGNRNGEANVLGNQGNTLREFGRLADAADSARRAISLCQQVGSVYGEAVARNSLAATCLESGRPDLARTEAGQALEIARRIADRRIAIDSLAQLAIAAEQLAELDMATGYHEQALTLSRQIAYSRGYGDAIVGLGRVQRARGNLDTAEEYARQGVEHSRATGQRGLQGEALDLLCGVYLDRGDRVTATEYAKQAVAVYRTTGNQLKLAAALIALADATGHSSHRVAAQEILARVQPLGPIDDNLDLPSDPSGRRTLSGCLAAAKQDRITAPVRRAADRGGLNVGS